MRLLVAVEETGSVKAGGAVLGLGQPAASARIREFEARWKLTLLTRSPRGSSFTDDGRAVVLWARSTLCSVDVMRSAVAALSSQRRSELCIAASLTVADYLLPSWLGNLHTQMPHIQPTLQVVNSTAVLDLVRSQRVDIGFIESGETPDSLAIRTVGTDRVIVAVRPDHRWARQAGPVSAEQLAAEHWVLREAGSGTRRTFELALGRSVTTSLEVSSTAALVGAALAGMGPAVVSERAVGRELRLGKLVEIPTTLLLTRKLTAAWHPERRLTDAAACLISLSARAPAVHAL